MPLPCGFSKFSGLVGSGKSLKSKPWHDQKSFTRDLLEKNAEKDTPGW